jgi:3',5'-cyclic AMP phosphodiesterase CpdA
MKGRSILLSHEADTETDAWNRALSNVRDVVGEERLSALVVTGDITSRSSKDGFDRQPRVLSELKGILPDKRRILVVPGNHDVKWETPSGSRERYAAFLELTDNNDYVRPLLDGIDFDATGKVYTGVDLERYYVAAEDKTWVMVPINSSNYCGTLEHVSPEAIEVLDRAGNPGRELRKALIHDIARISREQFKALGELVEHINKNVSAASTKIAVMHHQLLPVSETEEIRTFEYLTNLGRFRQFLVKHNFRLVLHGHKHVPGIFWDFIPVSRHGGAIKRHLIIAGPTVSGATTADGAACRIAEMAGSARAPRLRCVTVASSERPPGTQERDQSTYQLWSDQELANLDSPQPTVVQSSDAIELYERVLGLFDGPPDGGQARNLICHLEQPNTIPSLASAYAKTANPNGPERSDLLDELASWWQNKNTPRHRPRHSTTEAGSTGFQGPTPSLGSLL